MEEIVSMMMLIDVALDICGLLEEQVGVGRSSLGTVYLRFADKLFAWN